jgi:uncharacterized protein
MSDLDGILDRNRLRVRPIASKGPVQDLSDLLHRPDTDIAIVQTDALDAVSGRAREEARGRLRYLFRVPNEELHILVPRDITDIRQLEGRKVNIDRPESATHVTAQLVFEKLGIRPEFSTDDQATARQRLRSGEIQAAVVLASRPSSDILAFPSEGRFHLVSIPFEESVAGYPPGQLTADDYPNLVEPGRRVETVAVSRVLAVRDWPEGSVRYQRLARVANLIYAGLDELKKTGQNLRWQEVSPSAVAPGWERFRPAQNVLDRNTRNTSDDRSTFQMFAAVHGLCSLSDATAACQHFYDDFMAWRRERGNSATTPASDPERK